MADTTKSEVKRERDIYYYRKRLKNRIFAQLASFFADEAERTGITKKDIAKRLNKDPAQITRWLSGPSNLTLETLSDLLLALNAEAEPPRIIRFEDKLQPNYSHELITSIIGGDTTGVAMKPVIVSGSARHLTVISNPSSGHIIRQTEQRIDSETSA